MRKIILAFLFMLVSAIGAFAQSTTVSGTVTDASSQAWANGKYSFTFQPNPQFPTGPYTWSGGTLNNVISGTLDSSGAYSVSIPSNSAITPAGSTWILQVTPDATSLSFSTARTTITGGTQTLNATPPTILISWSLPPGPAISAYTDAEIGGSLPKGAEYFNTTSNLTRVWNGSAWANQGAGGGGGMCPAGPTNSVQTNGGANCSGTANFIYDGANITGTATSGGEVTFIAGPTGANGIQVSPSTVLVSALETGGAINFTADASIAFTTNGAPGDIIAFESPTIQEVAATIATRSGPSITDTVGSASPVTPGSVTQRVVTGTTDTILNTDRTNRVAYNSTTAVAVSLPTAGSTGFAGGFNIRISNQNTGTVTITPATGTINGNATLVLLEGQFCFLSPSSAGTSYAADCGESQMTAGTGISFTRAVHGLTIAATGATPFSALTSGTNTTAAMVVGTGASLSSVPEFDVGAVGTAGVIGLNGSTSGKATFTTNATGGSTTLNGTLVATGLSATSLFTLNGRNIIAAATPTIATGGCGGSGASIVNAAGTASFNINVGTGPTSPGCTITLGAATNEWNCSVNDPTTISATVLYQKQTAYGSTTATFQTFTSAGAAGAPNASDIYHVTCMAH